MSVRAPASVTGMPTNRAGLVVHVGNGYERMVMTDQEICDDVLATIPKLKAAVRNDTFGRRWKQRKRKNGVDMFELVPGGGDDPQDDLDIAHALVAKTELRCHLNEVLNVLINQQSSEYEASMASLCGSKFKRGQVLFSQRRKTTVRFRAKATSPSKTASESSAATDESEAPHEGLIGVQLATLRPKLRSKFTSKHSSVQRLCFASCTQQYPSKDRALHVIKTIPKETHDQIVPADDRTALRRELDHIAVGFDIRSKHAGYSASNDTTRIFVHTYASTVSPAQFDRFGTKTPSKLFSPVDLARRRESIMNPEAHHVMNLLTKSLRQIETVVRRRRLGFQTFIYFPTHGNVTAPNCYICQKSFSFFRRDYFCQLCGNMVCNDCSQNHEVEARIGDVRKNRCCLKCIVRVDACVFDDEDLLAALGPLIVDTDESEWLESSASDNDDTASIASTNSEISDSLFSADPTERSQALEQLAQLVGPSTRPQQAAAAPTKIMRSTSVSRAAPPSAPAPLKKKDILRKVENHLSESLREVKGRYKADDLTFYGEERDYIFSYDAQATSNADVPLAPIPEAHKEARRLKYIKASGVLDAKYDRAALNMLAQVAAKKLNCPIGFVSVIDEDQFRMIGHHELPEIAHALPRDENMCMHGLYAEKPMIIKNPRRDMRFAQMECIKDLGVQFYAGFPVRAPDGSVIASLCAADATTHHNISTKDYATMEVLSKLAADLILPKSPRAARPSYRASQSKAEPFIV